MEQDTEARILKAAEQEFMTKGLDGARTTSIARAAGVTQAMFHYYFRTKEKIFEKILSEKTSLLKQLLSNSLSDGSLTLEDRIRDIIGHHLDFIAANPEMPRFLLSNVLNDEKNRQLIEPTFSSIAPKIIATLQLEINKGADKGIYRRLDARTLIMDIISLNVMPFLAAPFFGLLTGAQPALDSEYIERRKQENFDTIMRKLKL